MVDEKTRAFLIDLRSALLGRGSPTSRIGRALSLLDTYTGVEHGEFVAAALGRGSLMLVGRTTKWTKFHDLARRFATREEAEAVLVESMKTWQTKHLWKRMVLTGEELRAYNVMEALK